MMLVGYLCSLYKKPNDPLTPRRGHMRTSDAMKLWHRDSVARPSVLARHRSSCWFDCTQMRACMCH